MEIARVVSWDSDQFAGDVFSQFAPDKSTDFTPKWLNLGSEFTLLVEYMAIASPGMKIERSSEL